VQEAAIQLKTLSAQVIECRRQIIISINNTKEEEEEEEE
jgi:hypothetical protein